jgi:hypothetical protein
MAVPGMWNSLLVLLVLDVYAPNPDHTIHRVEHTRPVINLLFLIPCLLRRLVMPCEYQDQEIVYKNSNRLQNYFQKIGATARGAVWVEISVSIFQEARDAQDYEQSILELEWKLAVIEI